MITVSQKELRCNGYAEIADQDSEGEVILRTTWGGLEVFQVRDSYSGWCIDTECGRVLEFCRELGIGGL